MGIGAVDYRYGGARGRRQRLRAVKDLLIVRTKKRMPLERAGLSKKARETLRSCSPHSAFPESGIEVLRVRPGERDKARKALGAERDIQFAGRVLVDPAVARAPAEFKVPVLYTENLFVSFSDRVTLRSAKALLKRYKLRIKKQLEYLPKAFFVEAPPGTGVKTFTIADALLLERDVEHCHPELVRSRRMRRAWPQQWHLKKTKINGATVDAHAHVVPAWRHSKGKGVTIAVIDDGFATDHPEFAGKVVHPRDVRFGNDDARPGSCDDHGTACAGVACASGRHGAAGVAPEAKLMPVRNEAALGSQAEADAFIWAATHGADIISCSWGPPDGRWYDPNDPRHRMFVPLPDMTRLAIDFAVTQGRGGKGCPVLFAAGNGNESIENDGYASYSKVLAVAACNDRGTRSAYSDYGKAVWCAFPSNDFKVGARPAPLTPGIWTTDRPGRLGYNRGYMEDAGDKKGQFSNDFGGTSSATPGAAGVVALMLAAKPSLTPDDVKEILKRSCDKIDPAGGKYDTHGHSPLYGYGRVNALRAVKLAKQF